MSRHAGDDELASYAAGELKRRKAAHLASHLTSCTECGARLRDLETMPSVLRSVEFPPMPDHLVNRISMAIAAESAARVASQPASEAGRRDLPARSRPARGRSWLPRLSSPLALRLAAGAGAAVVLAGGGYLVASKVTSSSSAPSGSTSTVHGPAVSPASGQFQAGPKLSYTQDGQQRSINAVVTPTNFKPGTLGTQAADAISSLKDETRRGPLASTTNSPALGQEGKPVSSAAQPSTSQLQGCVGRIGAGHAILLVEIAKYLTDPATIIVVAGVSPGAGEVFAVGNSCSAQASDILATQPLPKS